MQLVKGGVESEESIVAGALRELEEESGIVAYFSDGPIWESTDIVPDQIWHFVGVEADDIPDSFSHWTSDGGGHLFDFFWWPLNRKPDLEWHAIFVRALGEIRALYDPSVDGKQIFPLARD